jgi:hypothetical protein
MHILSSINRSEFLATPTLVRFDFPEAAEGREPTLLVKTSTLMLKYIVQGVRLQLVFARVQHHLLYAIRVYDDSKKPAALWSLLERDEEKAALQALLEGKKCSLFLFNELAINVASASVTIPVDTKLVSLVAQADTGRVDHATIKPLATSLLERVHVDPTSVTDAIVTDIPTPLEWTPIKSSYITSDASVSLIDLFHVNEGDQQEQIALWLTDHVHPLGVYHSPQVTEGKRSRELTDILLSYSKGAFLIESKTLAILTRDTLPNRAKLSRNVSGHIQKALTQLRGGIRRLKDGVDVTSTTGAVIAIERAQPMHAIVLVPDLDLLDPSEYGRDRMREFTAATGGFPHILDICELLRVVQAVEMVVSRSTRVTPIEAFDYFLLERFKRAWQAGTLRIEILHQVA